MLRIRADQIAVFEEAALRNFEDRMLEHLTQFSPKYFKVLGEVGTYRVIRCGVDRAKQYGLTDWGPVRLFIESMLLLGRGFDTDPQLPWAAEILGSKAIEDQYSKTEHLYQKIIEYLNTVGGPNYEYVKEALRRAVKIRFEDLHLSRRDFKNQVIESLQTIYPEKCKYLGKNVLRSMIEEGILRAKDYRVTTIEGVSLFIGLGFALGHEFASDPRFPWAAIVLNDAEVKEPHPRDMQLYGEMLTFLAETLAEIEMA